MEWLSHNWGNVASLAGLAVGVVVLLVSKRAVKAAKEAKTAIERRSAAQDLRDCGDKVSLMRLLCDSEKWDVSSFVCNGLLQELSFVTNRWALHFSDDTKENLNLLAAQLDTLNGQLRKFINRQPRHAELEALATAMANISTILSAEVGRYESFIER